MPPSGMITFVLLVVFIDCLNGQPMDSLSVMIKASSRTARIQCEMPSLGSNALHWYRLKDQVFQRLMYFEAGSNKGKKDLGVPARYAGSLKGNTGTLTISTLELSDEGSYYCAHWSEDDKKVFGPGTRLYVTGNTESPKVSGYLPSKKSSDKDDIHTMLCHARDMIPDLVKFTWQKKSGTKDWEDVNENVVEQSYKVKVNNKDQVKAVSSMMIIDKNTAENNDYQCIVTHEGVNEKPQTLLMKKDEIKPPMVPTKKNCPATDETIKNQISGDSEQIRSLYVFVYAYGVMIMKNVLYFFVVTIFLLKRKAARKKDETS